MKLRRCSLDEKQKNLQSTQYIDWLASEGALYLVQTWNHYFASVGADVLFQTDPLPLFGAGLKNKGGKGRVLHFRRRPLQNNACWALISRQRQRRLWFTSPHRSTWCGGNKNKTHSQLDVWRKKKKTLLQTTFNTQFLISILIKFTLCQHRGATIKL